MMAVQNPDFVLVQVEDSASAGAISVLPQLMGLAEKMGGQCLATVSSADVDALEPGSVPYTSQIFQFANEKTTEAFWSEVSRDNTYKPLIRDSKARVLAAQGLPLQGLPGDPLPTIASISETPEAEGPPAYMFIDGEAYDHDRLMIYRGIIFELMIERSSYYLAICEADGVRVLSGEWNEKIFAISKWPSVEHGRDFWYCDRYQNEGIPTRTGAGHFHVNLFEGK
jgi:uncharacterized protein (DUF1330 family)